jgi:transketolase
MQAKMSKSIRDVYGEMLLELGAEHPEIVVLDADLSGSTRTKKFGERWPERFFNMGVSEMSMVATAAGLAVAGKVPFASTFAIFMAGRALEVVRQSVSLPNVNVKLIASHGGVTVGEDGASHQMIEDIANIRILPNMAVIVPADGNQMRAVVRAIYAHRGPVYVRMAREAFPELYPEVPAFALGRADVLRPGGDLTLVGCGRLVWECLEAAETLAATGVSARVVNCASIKPLDRDTIVRAARETGAVVTAEEHLRAGGMGSAVAELLAEEQPVPMRLVGVDDRYGRSGKPDQLLELHGLTARHIVKAAEDVLKRKRSRAAE